MQKAMSKSSGRQASSATLPFQLSRSLTRFEWNTDLWKRPTKLVTHDLAFPIRSCFDRRLVNSFGDGLLQQFKVISFDA